MKQRLREGYCDRKDRILYQPNRRRQELSASIHANFFDFVLSWKDLKVPGRERGEDDVLYDIAQDNRDGCPTRQL